MHNSPQKDTRSALTAEQIETLHQRLLEEREHIVQLYRRDLKTGQKSVEEASEDLVDRANLAYNRELIFSLSDGERELLKLIDEALERIETGVYGKCLYSGEPIGYARLQAVPWARYRVEFQEMAEQGLLVEED